MNRIREHFAAGLVCLAACILAAGIGLGLGNLALDAVRPAQAAIPLTGHQAAISHTAGVTTATFVKLQTASASVPTITTATAATDQVIGVCTRTAASGGLTRYAPMGTTAVVTAGEAIKAGTYVVAGTAGAAFCHTSSTGGQIIAGRALSAATAAAETITVALAPFIVEEATTVSRTRTYTRIAANTTLDANATGRMYRVDANATITLPAPAINAMFTFFNGAESGTIYIKLAPASGDNITGVGTTGTANYILTNTKATAVKGNFISLRGGRDAHTWYITRIAGTWAWGAS
jgi:hypothetical protein